MFHDRWQKRFAVKCLETCATKFQEKSVKMFPSRFATKLSAKSAETSQERSAIRCLALSAAAYHAIFATRSAPQPTSVRTADRRPHKLRMVTGVPARLWSTATARHRVRRCRRTRGNRKIFVIWPPSPVCAFPTKLKVRIWGGGKGRRKERERGCLPRPVLLPYYTQGNNNYTCRNNKAIIIIVAKLRSSRSLIVICFRIMPAQCRRQCQSLNSILFHNSLISQNLVPINSSTKKWPALRQSNIPRQISNTRDAISHPDDLDGYSNEPKWTRALSKWRCVQNDEAPGRWWTHGSQAQSPDRQTSPSRPTMRYALCTMHYALCTMHYALYTMQNIQIAEHH